MSKNSKKRFGPVKIITMIIVAIVLVVGVAAAIAVRTYGFSNIMALYRGLTSSTSDIQAKIDENKQATDKALADIGVTVGDDMFTMIEKGGLTEEELAAMIYESMQKPEINDSEQPDANAGENTQDVNPDENTQGGDAQITPPAPQKDDKSTQGAGTNTGTQTNPTVTGNEKTEKELSEAEEAYNQKVAELVAKMYVIKADFVGRLASFEADIKAQYKALPAEERNQATKARIVSENMSYVAGLEAQCDAQVKAVTDELTELMNANGKDTSLVDAINSAYANEKELKKAYYISLYNK
jgi:type II secretory pathway pseudopilin PulG